MPPKIVKLVLVITWTICTIIISKALIEYVSEAKASQQRIEDLYTEKEHWRRKYNQTLENEIEWLIEKETSSSRDKFKYVSLGKDFDLKANLAGLVTINHEGKETDYRFKLVFDRNGLPILQDFGPSLR